MPKTQRNTRADEEERATNLVHRPTHSVKASSVASPTEVEDVPPKLNGQRMKVKRFAVPAVSEIRPVDVELRLLSTVSSTLLFLLLLAHVSLLRRMDGGGRVQRLEPRVELGLYEAKS
jgi:hypothetical protein